MKPKFIIPALFTIIILGCSTNPVNEKKETGLYKTLLIYSVRKPTLIIQILKSKEIFEVFGL